MENAEIARVFAEIADLLEVKGENTFRIRSYRNAALAIEGYPESVRKLYDRGEEHLEEIPGVGKGIHAKIVELLTSGRCAYHDELLEEIPQGIFEVLKVGGVGPKKAALLYKELGISSIEELEAAAAGRKLRDLPGMGARSEEKILKAIKSFRTVSGRFRLSVARSHANALVEHLQKVKGVKEVVPAGSLRRWKDSIGDIDILAICADSGPVMGAFVKYPEVREVVEKGETRSAVILNAGIRVDLRVLEKSSFGAALQYFTGSQAHNVALRDRAKRMGLKISEYGVFREKDDKRIAGRTEEEVYESVGLAWIPPELRENRGEIEAAEANKLPRELHVEDLRGDLHAHTTESDGGSTLEEMAGAAMERGYEYLAITDHSKAVGVAHGLDEKRVRAQMDAIDGFNEGLAKKGVKFRLLKGAEVDIRADGTLDHPEAVLERLDCVVAAVHSSFAMSEKDMTNRIVKAIKSGYVNIVAHPTGRLIGSREPYELDIERIMDEAAVHNVAMEINSYPDRLDLSDVHAMLARSKGLKVAISTDSHSTLHLANIIYGVHAARRAWLEKKDVLNAMPLKDLVKFLKKG